MSTQSEQAKKIKELYKTIREQTIEIEQRHHQILALAAIISDQKLLIKKLTKPPLWKRIKKLKK